MPALWDLLVIGKLGCIRENGISRLLRLNSIQSLAYVEAEGRRLMVRLGAEFILHQH